MWTGHLNSSLLTNFTPISDFQRLPSSLATVDKIAMLQLLPMRSALITIFCKYTPKCADGVKKNKKNHQLLDKYFGLGKNSNIFTPSKLKCTTNLRHTCHPWDRFQVWKPWVTGDESYSAESSEKCLSNSRPFYTDSRELTKV